VFIVRFQPIKGGVAKLKEENNRFAMNEFSVADA
jgi:hypothetical protein